MSVLTLNVDEVMRTLSAESSNPFVVYDKEVDIVRFAINSGFADIVLDGQVALRVMYQRPGESQVRAQTLTYYDTDGLHNYYDWQLAQSDLAKNGSLMVALCILDISGGEVSEWHTTPCAVRVLPTIHTDDSDEGDDTITPTVKERVAVLETMIQRVASGAPIVVASTSAMTDTDQIYVLSTDGMWYYHNGSAWVAGGEYGAVATDRTLTQAGIPADAKATGDATASLEVIAGVVFERGSRIAIPSAQMSPSYYLDGTGKCVNNSTYKMLKYAVTPGDAIWLYATKDSAGTYQFQSSPSVPSSLPNSNLVGYPQTVAANEPIRVPAGASWIIISASSTNAVSGLYEYTTIRDVTDELESHISVNGADISDIKTIMYVKQERITIPSAQVSNSYYLNADGTCRNDSAYKLLKYEVTAGDRIWIYAPSISPGVYQFQNAIGIPSSGTNTNLIGSTYTAAVDNVVTVPEGASWLIISALKTDTTAGCYTYATLKSAVEQLQEDVENINDNLSLRSINGLEVEHKLDNARHAPGNPTLLTILHFSDLHGDTEALERIMSDAETLSASVDDYICTGDMVTNVGGNIASWWNPAVMTCIGNHESAAYSSENGYNWTAVSMADRNTYYIAPFEAGWEIVHTADTSYYYKDYATQKVRLIVMDAMLYTGTPGAEAETQTGWLVNLLSDAIANGLHVMIAIHSPHGGAVAVDCSFSRYGQGAMPIWSDCNTPDAVIDAVSTAITNGLHFIGYIIGHTHQDNIWDATGDGSQMMYCVTCANVAYAPQWRNSDQFRNVDNDAYNLVTIDTTNTLIKIVRGGGADIDDHMRARKAICVNYSTGEVVGEVL